MFYFLELLVNILRAGDCLVFFGVANIFGDADLFNALLHVVEPDLLADCRELMYALKFPARADRNLVGVRKWYGTVR